MAARSGIGEVKNPQAGKWFFYLIFTYAFSIVKKGNSEMLSVINKVLDRLIQEGKIEQFVINHTS